MRRNLWGICLAFGVAILALVSVHAEEEQMGTPPSIVAGQEEQYGTAHPASADGAIPAVPYRANVSDWFESDTEMTYKWEQIRLTIDGVQDKKESLDLEDNTAMLIPVSSAATQVYDPNVVYNIKLDTVTGELIYEPKITEVGKTIAFYVRAKNEFGYSKMITLSIHVKKTVNAKNAELTIVKDEYQPISNNMFYQEKVAFLAKIRTNGNEIVKVLLNEKQLISWYVTFSDYKYDSETGDLSIYGTACKELTPGEHTVTIEMSGGEDLTFPVTVKEKISARYCSVGLVSVLPSDIDGTLMMGDIQQIEVPYGETIDLPEYKDTKYYRFMGWWSTAANPVDSKLYTSDTPITYNVGLRPRWERIEYQIRFLNYNENVYQEDTKIPDEKMELPPEPERKGYHFMGWYTEQNGQGEQLTEETIVTGDTDYYAYWRKGSIGCGGAGGSGWSTNQPGSSEQPKKRKSSGGKSNYVSWGAKVKEQDNTDTEKLEVPTEEPSISAKKESIMNGYSDGTFRPEQTLSRADAEKVLKRIAAEESLLTDDKIPFENIFKNQTVTRGVFCAALAKALNILPAESSAVAFGDLHNDTNKEYICALVDMGIIKGYGDDTFRPEQLITRAETAAMINRVLKRTDSQSAVESKFSDVFPTDWYYADVMNVCAYME